MSDKKVGILKDSINPVLELTPNEAKKLSLYIQGHPNEYIDIFYTLGLGIGYTLTVCGEKSDNEVEITDFDSF